uniref:Uncharacterized protein n=1 Tax=Rhizophora mucronata TaxID=61149 RepID=A0A2P2NH84_RHIMU
MPLTLPWNTRTCQGCCTSTYGVIKLVCSDKTRCWTFMDMTDYE